MEALATSTGHAFGMLVPATLAAICVAAMSFLAFSAWQSKLVHATGCNGDSTKDIRPLPLPPGPWVLPYAGDTLRLVYQGLVKISTDRQAIYGPIHRTWILGERNVFVADAACVRKILNGEHTIAEEDWPLGVCMLLGYKSVAVLTFDDHLNMRKLMSPAFNPKHLARGIPRLVELAEEHCREWAQKRDVMGAKAIKAFTFHAAVELVLGFEKSWVTKENLAINQERFLAWTDAFTHAPMDLPGFKFRKANQARRELIAAIKDNLLHLQAKLQDPTQDRLRDHRTSIELALEASLPPSDSSSTSSSDDSTDSKTRGVDFETLADTSLNLLFAGHDTSASAIMLAVRHLKIHPEVLLKLRQEQQEVIDTYGTDITDRELAAMPYTTAIVKETLRQKGIVSHVWRKALVDIELGGYRIPKGWKMNLDIWKVLLDDPRWADQTDELAPSKFNPSRWMTEEGQSGLDKSWIPFGGGARKCMGYNFAIMEIKVILSVLARKYDWSVDVHETFIQTSPLPAVTNGMPMKCWTKAKPLQPRAKPAAADQADGHLRV